MKVLCPRCDQLHVLLPLASMTLPRWSERALPFYVGKWLHPVGMIRCGKATIYVYERTG